MKVIELQDVTRVYKIGQVETQALRGVTARHRGRRIHRAGRPVGFRQDDAAATARLLDRPTSGRCASKAKM